jgi:predicted  nucleic acid-binding Zn-ribbon protein
VKHIKDAETGLSKRMGHMQTTVKDIAKGEKKVEHELKDIDHREAVLEAHDHEIHDMSPHHENWGEGHGQ